MLATCHDALCLRQCFGFGFGSGSVLVHLWADQIPHWRNECATNLGLCLFEVNAFRARADNEGVVSWRRGCFGGRCVTKAALACVICAFQLQQRSVAGPFCSSTFGIC